MKKKWCFFIIIVLLCFNNSYALAGDVDARIWFSLEPGSALIIGEVVKIENDNILDIRILRVVSGEVKKSQIKYDNPMLVKRTSVGKYLLLSVEKEDDIYKECYPVYYEVNLEKGDKISDIKSIAEETEAWMDEEWEVSLQWFCNTGTILRELGDDSGKYYGAINGVGVTDTLVYDMNEHKWYKNQFSDEYTAPNTKKKGITIYIIGGVLLIVFSVGLGRCLNRRKKRANESKE